MNSNDKTKVFQGDCMEFMKDYPDKHFELAIVDPPYGWGDNYNFRHNDKVKYDCAMPPDIQYFKELERVSKERIVWGGNYFADKLPVSRGYICWDKMQQETGLFGHFELAWSSFDRVAKFVRLANAGFNHADKRINSESTIHPTQKPVALYKWLLKNYAKPGDKILDTHMGSQSSRIAAYEMGFEYTGFELYKDYFEAGCKRFAQHASQFKLFGTVPNQE